MVSISGKSSARSCFLALLCTLLVFGCFTPVRATGPEGMDEENTEELYVENEWNYVDASMDVSQGIPEDAQGRLGKILAAGKLTVATDPYYAPQEFIDPSLSGQEQYVGADMELARAIAGRMGVELEIVPMDFTKVLSAATDGDCDLVISGLAYTPGRASTMELSKGYHYAADDAGTGLLIREADKEKITGTQDLADKDIVAQSGSLQEMLLAENVLNYHKFSRVHSIQDVYRAVQDQTADAAAVDIETGQLYIRNNPDCGLCLVDNVHFRLEEQFDGDRIAAQKGELQLMYFVNGVIDELLETGQYSEWFAEYTEYARKLGL